MKKGSGRYKKLFAALLVILILPTILFRYLLPVSFIGRTYNIPTSAMNPAIKKGDIIFARQLFSSVDRGDIIVFNHEDKLTGDKTPWIKRVEAIPGDTIAIKKRNLYINGSKEEDIEEYYYLPKDMNHWILEIESYTLGANEYFVMGDERKNSLDSRTFGPVKQEDIIAKYSFKLNAIRYWLFIFN